jgi:hypothetical protein
VIPALILGLAFVGLLYILGQALSTM